MDDHLAGLVVKLVGDAAVLGHRPMIAEHALFFAAGSFFNKPADDLFAALCPSGDSLRSTVSAYSSADQPARPGSEDKFNFSGIVGLPEIVTLRDGARLRRFANKGQPGIAVGQRRSFVNLAVVHKRRHRPPLTTRRYRYHSASFSRGGFSVSSV